MQRVGCTARERVVLKVSDRYHKAQVALQWIQAHCKQMYIKHVGTRVKLANVYITMHMLLGCIAWDHCFGS